MVTQLLIGIGMALFVVILAWGGQIRAIQKDTRELERELVETKKFPWQDIRFLIRPDSTHKNKIKALGNLMKKRKLKSKNIPDLLNSFEKLDISKKTLKTLNKSKYQFALYSTISFLVCGLLSLWTFNILLSKTNEIILTSNSIFLTIPFIFVIVLFFKIIKANKEEEKFTSIIEDIYNNLY